MYVIYIYEEKAKIFSLVYDLLKEKNNAVFIDGIAKFTPTALAQMEKNNIFLFFRAGKKNAGIFSDVNLCAVGNIVKKEKKLFIENCGSVMFNSENIGTFSTERNPSQYITCGLKEKDTIMLSSFGEVKNEVLLNLQRSISGIDGKLIESFEKKLILNDHIKSISYEDLLIAFGVLTFCGLV